MIVISKRNILICDW